MVIVAGGGLSGLSAAYYLAKKYSHSKLKLCVVEATKRCGGWVESSRPSEDCLFEVGPRTVRPRGAVGANTLDLIEELDLGDSVVPIPAGHPAATNRLIYAKGRLNMLPTSPLSMLTKRPPFERPLAYALLHDWRSKDVPQSDDVSTYDFVKRRFGKDIADYAVSAMLCGICAGDAKQISARFLMNTLFEMEQKHGGILRAALKGAFANERGVAKVEGGSLVRRARSERWSVYSLEGGLERLPLRLAEALCERGIKTYTEHRIKEIFFFDDNKRAGVKFRDDYAFTAERLFSCLPACELSPLLENTHPILAEELASIPFVDVAVVNLQYDSPNLIPQEGFGFLVPPIEKRPILGVIYDSCCFPNSKGSTVLTAMMGGRWFEDYFGKNPSDDDLLNVATSQIREIMHVKEDPSSFKVSVLRKCIPQYVVGHRERVRRIRQYIDDNKLPLSLCGASYDGVGVNDVIMSSKEAVDNSVLV